MTTSLKQVIRSILSRVTERQMRNAKGVRMPASVKLTGGEVSLQRGCKLSFGENTEFGGRIVFDCEGASVSVGERTFIGQSTIISAERVEIGSDVLISWGCVIVDHESHSIDWVRRKDDVSNWLRGVKDWSHVPIVPVKICDKAWLGFNVIVLKGVTIGEGAVVGAGSVVTKDVDPYTVVAGNPARVIKTLSPPVE